MDPYTAQLDWIDSRHDGLCDVVSQWAAINTGSLNLGGLERFTGVLAEAFGVLGGRVELLDLEPRRDIDGAGRSCETPLAKAIHITQRPDTPLRVFLGIHMDTVYPVDHPFQTVQRVDDNTLKGPGVADAKGGLAVMLTALQALERSGLADGLGWDVLVNPDEELGSPGSAPLLARLAGRNHLGLVFEPTLPDGTLVGARGGSGNYTVVVRGRSAHAGRQFHLGRNAIDAMARLITALSSLNGSVDGATVNVGQVEGGGAVNVVPDLAICRFNVRVSQPSVCEVIEQRIAEVVGEAQQHKGITVELHGGWTSPPKPMDTATEALFGYVSTCGQQLGLPIRWEATGGVCDGNKLAAAGLPTVDTLGPRGGGIHSPDEYLLLDSLTERAKLTALLLMKLATGELVWPAKSAVPSPSEKGRV